MSRIELRSVGVRYEATTVLSDLDLDIHNGEFLTLLGPSGCGKSTTLNLIAGLLDPTSGDVLIDSRSMHGVPPRDRKVAMVFQDYALYPHMTVFENLAFPLKAIKLEERLIQEKIASVAESLSISALLERTPKALSGGQRQRVALGRALVRAPGAFLMDEPLSNLDARLRVAMRSELKRLHQHLKTTMVYVTHDQSEAMTLSSRIAVLKDGILQQVGTPKVIYERPANQFVAGFIGALGMNFMKCTLQRRASDFWLEAEGVALKFSSASGEQLAKHGQEIVVGFRPEHISVCALEGSDLRATVEVIEYLGSETLVHLGTAGTTVVCKSQADTSVSVGEIVGARIVRQPICYFDPTNGLLLNAGSVVC